MGRTRSEAGVGRALAAGVVGMIAAMGVGVGACASGSEFDDPGSGGSSSTNVGGSGGQNAGGAGGSGAGGPAGGQGGTAASGADGGSGGTGGIPMVDCGSGSGWEQLGSTIDEVVGADASSPRLARDIDGSIWMTWAEGDPTDVFVARYDGNEWVLMGDPLDATVDSQAIAPVIATAGGERVVAWSESNGTEIHPHAARWDGTEWVMLPPLGNGPMFSFSMSLLLDGQTRPVLAWNEFDGTATNVRVARYEGTAWAILGSPLSAVGGGSGAIAPTLTVDSQGDLYAAWGESSDVYVQRWDGGIWTDFASADVSPQSYSFGPLLATTSTDDIVVAYAALGAEATDSFVQTHNGAAWSGVSGALSAETGNTNAVVKGLALDSADEAVVAWPEDDPLGVAKIHVYRQSGVSFSPVGGGPIDAIGGDTDASFPDVIFDGCDQVVAAWTEDTISGRLLYAYRYY